MRIPRLLTTALLFSCPALHAATITQTVPTGAYNETDVVGVLTTNVNQFNPALGTLNSISFSVSGPYTAVAIPPSAVSIAFPAPAAYLDEFVVYDASMFNTTILLPVGTDTGTLNLSEIDLTPLDLLAVSGVGTVPVDLGFTLSSVTDISTPGLTQTVTYDYTPTRTAATPEPPSFVLLGTGLLGTFCMGRKLACGDDEVASTA